MSEKTELQQVRDLCRRNAESCLRQAVIYGQNTTPGAEERGKVEAYGRIADHIDRMLGLPEQEGFS